MITTASELLTAKITDIAEVFFIAIFDNDMFDYTDYYYTSGISLGILPSGYQCFSTLQSSARIEIWCELLWRYPCRRTFTHLVNLLGLEVRVGDRPFASYLISGIKGYLFPLNSHRRLQSEISLGVIGPASLGRVSPGPDPHHDTPSDGSTRCRMMSWSITDSVLTRAFIAAEGMQN